MKAASLSARLDRMPMVKAVAPFAAGILAADCFTLPLWFLAGAFLLSGTLALLLHSQSGALVMLLTAGFAASQLRDTAHTLPRGTYRRGYPLRPRTLHFGRSDGRSVARPFTRNLARLG